MKTRNEQEQPQSEKHAQSDLKALEMWRALWLGAGDARHPGQLKIWGEEGACYGGRGGRSLGGTSHVKAETSVPVRLRGLKLPSKAYLNPEEGIF